MALVRALIEMVSSMFGVERKTNTHLPLISHKLHQSPF